ncbi:M23 family metallopeptidase [Stenotrophomonas sp. RAC2]|uniref:M23 family metallopeptidase n=1 Tax=Stenotrophomonas sp. RAC2 TaxID=3064902 RepID=UPI002716AE55|nr:M23 family metallopeptidase [Stenotrophomonas sp. RAC2]MDV9043891.1 M23 family metallopeptidase [Stenotrophomonas sp. RAC2]
MIRSVCLALLLLLPASLAWPAPALAPVEARVPFAPPPFTGSDGLRHLAYELHITNYYGDTGVLLPQSLQVFGDDGETPLLSLDGAALRRWVRPSPSDEGAVSIAPGKRLVVFLWLSLPTGDRVPRSLRHRMLLGTEQHGSVELDGAHVTVNAAPVSTLGPPLQGGRWLAHEGPGAAQSHHWGSLVAVNGDLTIPQRFALDLVGVDDRGRAVRATTRDLQHTHHSDWVGYAAPVLAVADGIVRAVRDGQPEHAPLTPQPEPVSLTADGLFGNHVVLELSPGVFASYAHLRTGSIKVKPGQRVQRGQALAQLGQSGNSAAPHLHFQLSNKATFEGAEGIPYVFQAFDDFGPESEAQLFGQGEAWKPGMAVPRENQLPLNDIVIAFPPR